MASPATGLKTVSTPGTRVALSATSIRCCSVTIKCNPSNKGGIYIVDSTVASSNCLPLSAGESLSWDADPAIGLLDLADIYIDAHAVNDGVGFWYVREEA